MPLFRKKNGAVDRELRALEKEMRVLEKQIHQLQRNPAKAASPPFKPAAAPFTPRRAPAPAVPVAPPHPQADEDLGLARERDLWTHAADAGRGAAAPGGLRGWWQSLFAPRPGPADPKLVSYLSAGSFKTVRPLRYERRVARNRFLVGLGLLIGTTALLMLALKNC